MREAIDRLLRVYECGHVSRRDLLLTLTGMMTVSRTAAAETPRAPLAVEGINHVTLFVSDRERSVEFYQRLFDFPIQSTQPAGTNLSVGAGNQFLGIFEVGRVPRIDHICLSVRDFEHERVAERLAEHGVESRIGMRGEVPELYFTDPDGLSVQLQDARYCGGSGVLGDGC